MATFTAPNSGTPGTEISALGWTLLVDGACQAVIGGDGQGIASSGSGSASVYGYDTGSSDHQIIYDYEGVGSLSTRTIVSWVNGSNYIYVRLNASGGVRIYQRLNATDTVLSGVSQVVGTRYKLRKAGTTITVRDATTDAVIASATCDASLNGSFAAIMASGAYDPWLGNVVIQANADELTGAAIVTPAAAMHAHRADTPAVGFVPLLRADPAVHGHALSEPALGGPAVPLLSAAGSIHRIAGSDPSLVRLSTLAPSSVVQSLSDRGLSLSASALLVPGSSRQAISSSPAALGEAEEAIVLPPLRTDAISFEDQEVMIRPESRLLVL